LTTTRKTRPKRAAPAPAAPSDPAPAAPPREYEWVDPRSLRVWTGNPKSYTDGEVEELAQSVRRFGWGRPLVVNRHGGLEGEIIGGHRSQLVGLKLLDFCPPGAPGPGLVPVVWRDLPAKQAHALAMADTRVPKTELQQDKLQTLARSHELDAGDWQAAGFAEREIRSLMFDPWPELNARSRSGAPEGLKYQVIIDCRNEAQQTELLEWCEQQSLTAKPWVG
jgi:hypothetical protein